MKFPFHILIALPLLVHGQGNLVPNAAFEVHHSCPGNDCDLMTTCIPSWATPNVGSPDYYHFCTTNEWALPTHNVFGGQLPLSGDAFVGIYCFTQNQPEGREYIQVQLTEPLYAGVRYKVGFHVSLADMSLYAISSLGAHLSTHPLYQNDYWVIDVEPQIQNPPGNIIVDTTGWVLITDTFITRSGGGEQWLTIGNFNYAADSDTFQHRLIHPYMGNFFFSYYYIDDVSVIALDSIPSGVEEVEQNQGIYRIYPNPSNGTFTIAHALHNNQMAYVEVYDLLGQRILTQQWSSAAPIAVDLTGVSSGLYTVRILVDNELKFSEKVSVIRP